MSYDDSMNSYKPGFSKDIRRGQEATKLKEMSQVGETGQEAGERQLSSLKRTY